MRPKAMSTTPAQPHISASVTQPTIAKTLNLHIQGAFKQVQWTSPTTSMPVSQHSTSRRKLPSVALGAPPPTRVEKTQSDWREQTQPCPSQWLLTCRCHNAWPCPMTSTSVPISHSPSLPPVSKCLTVPSIASTPKSETCPMADLGPCLKMYLNYWGK